MRAAKDNPAGPLYGIRKGRAGLWPHASVRRDNASDVVAHDIFISRILPLLLWLFRKIHPFHPAKGKGIMADGAYSHQPLM